MKRPLVFAFILALAGAAAFLVLRGRGDKPTPPAVTETPAKPSTARSDRDPGDRAASAERRSESAVVLLDDDPPGALQLEGQVVDDAEDGVADAEVILGSNPPRRTVTEKDGSFHFDKLVGRRYELLARAPAGVAGPVTAQLTAGSEPVILRVRPASKVEVTVVSAGDRSPIPGATVELRNLDAQTTVTDAEGKAVIAPVVPERYQVVAYAPGHAKEHTWLRVAPGQDVATARIALRPGAAVSGRVVAPDGAAVAGAQVLYSGASEWAQRADPQRDAATTDQAGAFRFDALPAGTFRFTARDPEHAPGTSDLITLDGAGEATDVVITLQAAAVVRGRVDTVDGAAVASARVRVAVRTDGFLRGETRQAYTDQSGAFELRGLPRKPLELAAVHELGSSETAELDMENPPHERELILVLENTEVISGVVVDTEGEPVEGAQVSAFPNLGRGGAGRGRGGAGRGGGGGGGGGGGRGRGGRGGAFRAMRLRGFAQELTDAGGSFTIRGLEPGSYEVRASPPGGGQENGFLREPVVAETGDTDVRIVLPADGTIKGKVALPGGGAPELFTVSVGGFGGGVPFATEDGSFELTGLPPQTYTVAIRGAGFDSKQVGGVEVEPGATKDMGTITVVRGRSISGRVTRAGQPIADATVRAGRVIFGDGSSLSARFGGPPGAGGTKETTTDEDGQFSIHGVGMSDLFVIADHPGQGRSQAAFIRASPEPTSGLELSLTDTGALAGKARQGAEPAANISVSAQPEGSYGVQFGVSTGDDGAYRFDRLAPGKYKLSALIGNPMTGMRLYAEMVEVASAQATTKDLGVTPGQVTLTIELAPTNADSYQFALVRLFAGSLSASTANQLEQAAARAGGGFSAFAISFAGNPATIAELSPGAYTACAVPYPNELERRGMMEYMEREGDRLPAFCQPVTVAESPDAQRVVVPIELPAYVPPSTEPTPEQPPTILPQAGPAPASAQRPDSQVYKSTRVRASR